MPRPHSHISRGLNPAIGGFGGLAGVAAWHDHLIEEYTHNRVVSTTDNHETDAAASVADDTAAVAYYPPYPPPPAPRRRRIPWGVWVALIVGLPVLIIAVVAMLANQPDPSFGQSYQFGHDKLGPEAKQEADNGLGADFACQEFVNSAFDFEKAPAWWNPNMAEKGCIAYLSENN